MQEQSSYLRRAVAAVVSGPWFLAVPALAEESQPSEPGGPRGFIAAGAAANPEYEGASDYEAVPLIVGQLDALGLRFELEGLTARLNVRPDAALQFGPAASFRPGRDDVTNDDVDRLSAVDDAVELGGFLSYRFTEILSPGDELELGTQVLADVVDAHGGVVASLGVGYGLPLGQRWRLGLDSEITFASDGYVQTYFGIDSADARRSGLAEYDGEGGPKDVDAGVTLNYSISESWGLLGRVAYTRLIGDAADSPIVEREGTPDQVFAGLALSFRF